MFSSYEEGGFSIQFKNGIVVSVQFGPFHLCDYRKRTENSILAENVELAIYYMLDSKRVWLTRQFSKMVLGEDQGDDVLSYVEPEIIAKAISWAESY